MPDYDLQLCMGKNILFFLGLMKQNCLAMTKKGEACKPKNTIQIMKHMQGWQRHVGQCENIFVEYGYRLNDTNLFSWFICICKQKCKEINKAFERF